MDLDLAIYPILTIIVVKCSYNYSSFLAHDSKHDWHDATISVKLLKVVSDFSFISINFYKHQFKAVFRTIFTVMTSNKASSNISLINIIIIMIKLRADNPRDYLIQYHLNMQKKHLISNF